MSTRPRVSMRVPAKDRIGERFGLLTVKATRHWQGETWAVCLCDCGRHHTVRLHSLVENNTGSCGCLGERGRASESRVSVVARGEHYLMGDLRPGSSGLHREVRGLAQKRTAFALRRLVVESRLVEDFDTAREAEQKLEQMGAEVPR